MLALLNGFVYEYIGNNTYVMQEKTALICINKDFLKQEFFATFEKFPLWMILCISQI